MFNSFIFLVASKPVDNIGEAVGIKKNVKDPNRGFKVDVSGKLVIEEPKRGGNIDDDTDSDIDDMDEESKKKVSSDKSDSDDEITENRKAKSRKRQASSSLSQASGKTGTSSKYVSGGKGIHRPLNEAASVRSGYTNVSSKTDVSKKSIAGSDYRAKKSKGDMKKKGTFDPYAYIPLSRNTLNKRKRAKNSGQFKNIVQAARKGAAAGSKRRKV